LNSEVGQFLTTQGLRFSPEPIPMPVLAAQSPPAMGPLPITSPELEELG